MPTKPKRTILPPIQEGTPTMAYPFSEEDYRKAIAALKNNKAAGRDDVLVEQLKHLGPRANKCSTYASQETGSPRYGDNPSVSPYSSHRKTIPKNYRRLSLLCHTYKLYERMLINII